jgi:chitodextrinase
MNKILLITLFALATTVYSACDQWDRHAIYDSGDCVSYGGCDYDVKWWIQYNSPTTHPDRFTKHDTNCVDDYELPAFNCYPH